MTAIEYKILREFRKLSQEGRGEVLAYTKWIRDAENQERLNGLKRNDLTKQVPVPGSPEIRGGWKNIR